MQNKRGQFYIIAAVIIIAVISGIVTISNYIKTIPSPTSFESISSDLKEEGPRIVDYGIYSKEDLNKVLNNFTSSEFAPYFLQKTDNSNLIFIYGNKSEVSAVRYNMTSKGTISATIGGSTNWDTEGIYSEKVKVTPSGDSVNVDVLGKSYEFKMKENEMFYFLMIQQKQGETYITKNE